MTPLVKGWCTEIAMETTSLGVQVHGGMGFIEETGAAQHMRDARILPIYEGTNGIQALDFVGRKCLHDQGVGLQQLIQQMRETAKLNQSQSKIVTELMQKLQMAADQCQDALDYILNNPKKSQIVAYNYMMLFGNSIAYWTLARLAIAADDCIEQGSDDQFYHQKLATAGFFAHHLLARNQAYLQAVKSGSAYVEAFKA